MLTKYTPKRNCDFVLQIHKASAPFFNLYASGFSHLLLNSYLFYFWIFTRKNIFNYINF